VPYSDLADPQSLNLYGYVRNSPLSKIDADGHTWWSNFKERMANSWTYGEDVTNAELPAAFASERQWLINNVAQNQDEIAALKGSSDSEINGLYKKWDAAIFSAQQFRLFGGSELYRARDFVRDGSGKLVNFVAGGKTSGVLETSQGEFELQSGRSGPAELIPKGTPGFDAYTRTHVEGHAAALMRQQGIGEATLRINNPTICQNCSRNLSRMLPEGSRLNIELPGGSIVEFLGEEP